MGLTSPPVGLLGLVLHGGLPGDVGPDQFRVCRRQVALEAAHSKRRELAAEDRPAPQSGVTGSEAAPSGRRWRRTP